MAVEAVSPSAWRVAGANQGTSGNLERSHTTTGRDEGPKYPQRAHGGIDNRSNLIRDHKNPERR